MNEVQDGKPIMDIPQQTWARYSEREWYKWEPGCEYMVTRSREYWSWWGQTMTTPAEIVLAAGQFKPTDWQGFSSAKEAMKDCDYLVREMRDTSGT